MDASLPISVELAAELDRFRFNRERFEHQRQLLRERPYDQAHHFLAAELAPVPDQGLTRVRDRQALHSLGVTALKKGEVAVVLLNGGMATRFGGIAKGAATCFAGQSFLGVRLGQVAKLARELAVAIPIVVMNSFATDEATRKHLAEHQNFGLSNDNLLFCVQGISLRLDRSGEVFKDAGNPSPYAPGHGDLPWALAVSGISTTLSKRGVKTLFVSNVDNLGCGLDPLYLGAHLASGHPMTAEVVERLAGDVGGAPLLVNHHPELVEGFRLPPTFEQSRLNGFNTNTFYLDDAALACGEKLAFYPVAKKVAQQTAIQYERILGELSRFVSCQFLVVPRGANPDLDDSRFLPVKTPEDLVALEPRLKARFGGT